MNAKMQPVVVQMYPEYASVTNMVLAVMAVLQRFDDAIDTPKFHCQHPERPQVWDLINRGRHIVEDGASNLDEIESYMLDVALITPYLWD